MIKHIFEMKNEPKEIVLKIPLFYNKHESILVDEFKNEYLKKKDFYNEINNFIIKNINGFSVYYDGDIKQLEIVNLLFNHLEKKILEGHPSMDGKGHINIYSKGCTQLGRMLTNFYHNPINIPEDGNFKSIESYWYWLKTGDDSLRRLYGATAKKQGKDILKKMESSGIKHKIVSNFDDKIKDAMTLKVLSNKDIQISLKNSSLPFKHYYFYGKIPNVKIYDLTEKYKWQIDHFEDIRNRLKNDLELKFYALKEPLNTTQKDVTKDYGNQLDF